MADSDKKRIETRNRAKLAEIRRRRAAVADLYIKGMTQVAIASAVGCSRRTVGTDLEKLQRDWQQSAMIDFDEAKRIQLLKLDRIELESWDAWDRSKQQSKSVRQKFKGNPLTKDGKAVTPEETNTEAREQVGDPRFLKMVYDCIAKRCELLGLAEDPLANMMNVVAAKQETEDTDDVALAEGTRATIHALLREVRIGIETSSASSGDVLNEDPEVSDLPPRSTD